MKTEDAAKLFEGHKKSSTDKSDGKEVETEREEKDVKKIPISWQIDRIARLIGRITDRLKDTLTLRARRVIVTVSTDDAAKTALLYGAVSAALAGLIELLDRSVARVKTRGRDEINVHADFVGGKTTADVDIILSARVFGILRILFTILISGEFKKKAKHKRHAQSTPKAEPTSVRIGQDKE